MKKKHLLIGIAIGLVLNLTLVYAASEFIEAKYSDMKILAHGKQLDIKSLEYNDNIYIPFFSLCKALKLNAIYDFEDSSINIKNTIDNNQSLIFEVHEEPIYEKFEYSDDVKNSNNIEEMLKEVIDIKNSELVFTVYALLNYTGYDEQNFKEMGKVRKMIREDLEKTGPTVSYKNVSKSTGELFKSIMSFAFEGGQAPNFHPYRHKHIIPANIIKDFYYKADIESLYKKYEPYYDEEINKYQEVSYKAIKALITKLNIPIETLDKKINVNINLLDLQSKGKCVNSRTQIYKPVEISIGATSPKTGEVNITIMVHEFSHIFTNPVRRELSTEVDSVIKILERKYGEPDCDWPEYDTWEVIIEESLVRAISVMPNEVKQYVDDYEVSKSHIVKNQVKSGFVLTEYFYNYFKNLKSDKPFRELVKDSLLKYIDKNK